MAYYIIGGQPVFLARSRRADVTLDALKEWLTSDDPFYGYLHAKFEEDPIAFGKQWVEFDLRENEARANLQSLLGDYCSFYRTGYLTDLRDLQNSKERLRGAYIYPKGRIFALDHEIPVSRGWLMYRMKRSRTIRIVINSTTETRLVGTLGNFRIIGAGYWLGCDEKGLSILPSMTGRTEEDQPVDICDSP